MLSANSDIQVIFIDGILKQAGVCLDVIPSFIDTLDSISKAHNVDFYVSLSASKEELAGVDQAKCNYVN